MNPLAAVLQAPAGRRTTLDTGGMHIAVERIADGVQLSLRPAAMPAGFSDGPRVALSLSPLHARELAQLLADQAEGAQS
jgi:hypothetical protein